MISSDKIGSANFFWSFPSKATQDKKNEKERVADQISRCNTIIEETRNEIDKQKIVRCGDDRATKLAQYEELLNQDKEYDSILLAGKANDPNEVKRVLAAANHNMEQANRWTDNVWTVKKYLTSKKGMNGKEVSSCYISQPL